MISKPDRRKKRLLLSALLAASSYISSLIVSPAATAKLFDGPVDQLPLEQRVSLRRGELVFLGEEGEYVIRLLVETSIEHAWQVLTDYENFAEFLPGVTSSELLENDGDRKVFEQINQIKALVFSIESRVKIATTETYPAQINFQAVDGDLPALNGMWTLEPVSPYPSAPPDRVLITHRVSVQPGNTPSDSIFFGIYEDRLQETLEAIKEEVEKRTTTKQEPGEVSIN
ncbi:MAG: SRPBCC family protein [Cyanobacteria bacterium P01_G01_bin.67]